MQAGVMRDPKFAPANVFSVTVVSFLSLKSVQGGISLERRDLHPRNGDTISKVPRPTRRQRVARDRSSIVPHRRISSSTTLIPCQLHVGVVEDERLTTIR